MTQEDGYIDVDHASSVGKLQADVVALGGFAPRAISAACGPFGTLKAGRVIDAVVALQADGEVRIATNVRRNEQGNFDIRHGALRGLPHAVECYILGWLV